MDIVAFQDELFFRRAIDTPFCYSFHVDPDKPLFCIDRSGSEYVLKKDSLKNLSSTINEDKIFGELHIALCYMMRYIGSDKFVDYGSGHDCCREIVIQSNCEVQSFVIYYWCDGILYFDYDSVTRYINDDPNTEWAYRGQNDRVVSKYFLFWHSSTIVLVRLITFVEFAELVKTINNQKCADIKKYMGNVVLDCITAK